MVIEDVVCVVFEFVVVCKKWGIEDMLFVCIDLWLVGNFDILGEDGCYLVYVFVWVCL